MRCILFLFAIIFLGIGCKKKEHKLSSEVQDIVNGFSDDSMMYVGGEDYQKLLKASSSRDLLILTSHKNPYVRCYSFDALIEKDSLDVQKVFFEHLNDTVDYIRIYAGDVTPSDNVRTQMLLSLHPNGSSRYRFTRKEFDRLFWKYR